jgi:hypothetical protein
MLGHRQLLEKVAAADLVLPDEIVIELDDISAVAQ